MKFALLSLLALAILAGGCSSVRALDVEGVQTVSLSELKAKPKVVADALSPGGGGLILTVAKDEWIPLMIDVQGSFATVDAGPSRVRFTRDVMLYFSEDSMLISPDGKRWGPIHDPSALKELFEFDHGSMRVGFGVTETGALLSFMLRTE